MSVYQDLIFQHAKHPVGLGLLAGAGTATVKNSLCGDAVTVSLAWSAAETAALGFVSDGCSLCRASASLMITALAGQPRLAIGPRVAAFRAIFPSLDPVPAWMPVQTSARSTTCAAIQRASAASCCPGTPSPNCCILERPLPF